MPIPLLATLDIFSTSASVIIGVLGGLATMYLKARKVENDAVATVAEKAAAIIRAKEADSVSRRLPQPLLTQLAEKTVAQEDYDNHLARNREAHERFRMELDKQKEDSAAQRETLAVLRERSETTPRGNSRPPTTPKRKWMASWLRPSRKQTTSARSVSTTS